MKNLLIYVTTLSCISINVFSESQNLEPNVKLPKLDVNGPMVFTAFSACEGHNHCASDEFLLADGVIKPDSVELLQSIVAKHKSLFQRGEVDYEIASICFNSPGGDLGGALALGKYIREAKLSTCVSDIYRLYVNEKLDTLYDEDVKNSLSFDKNNISFDDGYVDRINTQCSSACVFAFIGGLDRSVSRRYDDYEDNQKTNIGVHQIRGVMGNQGDGPTQKQIAELNGYVRKMGVDDKLVDLVISTPPETITFLKYKTIEQLRLVGSSVGDREVVENKPSWDIFVDDSSKPYAKIKWQDINRITGEMTISRVNGIPSLEMRYTYFDTSKVEQALEEVFLVREKPIIYVEKNGNRKDYEIIGAQWRSIDGNTIALQGGISLDMIRSLQEGEDIGTDLWVGSVANLAPWTKLSLHGLPKLLPVVLQLQ
jgi:hypothetical protein